MKKPWEIVVSDKVPADIRRKLRQVLKPVDSVGRRQKCLFCGVDTTWVQNRKPVCPKCSVEHGFLAERYLPGPCEVCGKQGEWCTDGDPQHFLCYQHRDDWFHWRSPELAYLDHEKEPEKWHQAWEEGWAKFIALMKEHYSV